MDKLENKKISRKAFVSYVATFFGVLVVSKFFSKAMIAKSVASQKIAMEPDSYSNNVYGGRKK